MRSPRQFAVSLAVCLILSLPAPAGAQSTEPSSATSSETSFETLAAKAQAARETSRLDEALKHYRQAVEIRPSWKEGWWYLGVLRYGSGRFGEGRDALKQLTSLSPRNGAAWALLGLCEFNAGDYEQALPHLQASIPLGLNPKGQLYYATRYHTALLLTRAGEFGAALRILYLLGQDRFDKPEIVEAIGLALLRTPIFPQEIPEGRRELILQAGHAGAHHASDPGGEEPLREFQKLVTHHPAEPNVHYAYGVFLLSVDSDRALEEFRRGIELSPSHVAARLQIAVEYLKRGEFAAGLPYAEEAVTLAPESFGAHHVLGRVLLDYEEVGRAIQELEKAVELESKRPEIRFTLARAYARAGRREDAARERAEFQRLKDLRRAGVLRRKTSDTATPPNP